MSRPLPPPHAAPRRRGRRPLVTLARQGLITAAIGFLLLLAGGCSTTTLSLSELALEAEEHSGEAVATYGVVAEFGEADGAIERHFVLRDGDENRVRLLPDDAAEPHVGSSVEVTGTFLYDPTRGRSLHIDTIEPTAP